MRYTGAVPTATRAAPPSVVTVSASPAIDSPLTADPGAIGTAATVSLGAAGSVPWSVAGPSGLFQSTVTRRLLALNATAWSAPETSARTAAATVPSSVRVKVSRAV